MYYIKKTYVGEFVYVQKTYNSGMINAHGLSGREKKTREQTEKQRRHNEKLRIRNLTFLLQANFGQGDLNLTLHYPRGQCPDNERTAQKNVAACLKLLRKTCPDIKYVYCTHTTERGSIHHHLITSGARQYQVEAAWAMTVSDGKLSAGHTLYKDKQTYKQLAAYLIADDKHKPHDKGVRSYNTSRNLVKPETEITEAKAVSWKNPPTAPRGFRVSTVKNGRDIYGAPYQVYVLIPQDDETEIELEDLFWTGDDG
ncbi:MAG: hypothetical protein J6I96_02250 [Oscillospiraceae bacterium]|nr:hypothetical protein [Oscillospiraceae bacterium]